MSQVSIIIPNYNHAKYLSQRLESVYDQTYQDFEVILLDDCSNDASVAILNTYAKHPKTSHVVFNDKNSGSTFKQWAKGLALAKGEFIWIAESDDVADLSFLENLLSLFNKDENIGIVYSNSNVINEKEEITYTISNKPKIPNKNKWCFYNGMAFIKQYMLGGNMIPNASACLIKKEALQQVDLSNNPFKLSGDWLVYSLILSQYNLVFLDKPLNYFRFHSNNVRSKNTNNGLMWIEACEMFAILKNKKALEDSIISSAVNTPLVNCIDIFVSRNNELVNFNFLYKYICRFNKNPLKLIYGYLFRFKRHKNE
ncbi:glycosyltransferase [Flavobacteriaceae bacterium]|nr:glycosyltransferase [Flavobacteriaceae bacterium]